MWGHKPKTDINFTDVVSDTRGVGEQLVELGSLEFQAIVVLAVNVEQHDVGIEETFGIWRKDRLCSRTSRKASDIQKAQVAVKYFWTNTHGHELDDMSLRENKIK